MYMQSRVAYTVTSQSILKLITKQGGGWGARPTQIPSLSQEQTH